MKILLIALRFAGKNCLSFLFMLTPVFVCVGLMDVWIERDTMIKIMGVKSGFKGAIVALLLGVVNCFSYVQAQVSVFLCCFLRFPLWAGSLRFCGLA